MDVSATTSAQDHVERADVTVNAYELFWDCAERDTALTSDASTACPAANDAYTQFWLESDG